MNVRGLINKLKKVSGTLPVKVLSKEGYVNVTRDFGIDAEGWETFELVIGNSEDSFFKKDLDTEFLKHILDYGNKMTYVSYFDTALPFDQYEVKLTKLEACSNLLWDIADAYVRNVDGVTCFVLEE